MAPIVFFWGGQDSSTGHTHSDYLGGHGTLHDCGQGCRACWRTRTERCYWI